MTKFTQVKRYKKWITQSRNRIPQPPLAVKHKNNRDPKNWKGFKFAVPFDYSMHNFLLRYYVAEHGLDPDKDIQIRVTPPPEMVANLRAGNIDGFLGPDPFNQRAVYDEVGFIHCSTRAQIEATANRFYADLSELVLLTVDPLMVPALIVWEPPAPGVDELFPHIYGPLPIAAVNMHQFWTRSADVWSLPE